MKLAHPRQMRLFPTGSMQYARPFSISKNQKAFHFFLPGTTPRDIESCHNITNRKAFFLSHTYTDGRTAHWHVPICL